MEKPEATMYEDNLEQGYGKEPPASLAHMPTTVAAEHSGTILEHVGDTGRAALHPQPSLDPNDPLNWPKSKKLTTYLTICFFAFLGTVNTSKFAVAVVPIGKEFHTDATRTAFVVSFAVLMLGFGNLFWVILLRIVGRRPVYLAAIPIVFATNIWAYKATSFNSLLAASIVGGIGSAAAEAPTSAVVADLFFVHERGTYLMLFHLALSFGFFLGPFLNAYVVQYAGWRAICLWVAVAAAATWVVGFFTIHETAYRRRDTAAPASSFGPLRPLSSWLGVTAGYDGSVGLWRTAADMCAVVAYPAVPWVGLVVGSFVGWNIVVQLTSARVFTVPPYGWQLHDLGLLSLSGLIGALLATFAGGKLIDIISNRMTKRAGGRREPEYRLPAIILPGIIGPMGVLIFGLCVAHKTSWVGAAVGYGMQGFGLTAMSNLLVTYAVDSYLPLAGEVLVVVFVARGITGCLLSLYAFNWIEAAGTANAFGQMTAVSYFLCLFVLVFAFYGKRIRVATARYGPLRRSEVFG